VYFFAVYYVQGRRGHGALVKKKWARRLFLNAAVCSFNRFPSRYYPASKII
jgi:hypothetical protein